MGRKKGSTRRKTRRLRSTDILYSVLKMARESLKLLEEQANSKKNKTSKKSSSSKKKDVPKHAEKGGGERDIHVDIGKKLKFFFIFI